MTQPLQRVGWVLSTAALVAGLVALDGTRGGPAAQLSQCNLALTRSSEPAADVLVVGSSRTGTAVDPVAMERMLAAEPAVGRPTVERIALGRSPLRATVALLENYLAERGTPRVIVLEVSFITDRTVTRIEELDSDLTPDALLFRRDVNLLRYDQLLDMPIVASPSVEESPVDRVRHALRGLVLRTGALVYQFVREPATTFSVDECDSDAWTREPTWPADFSFSWGETDRVATPAAHIESLRAEAAVGARHRRLQAWQVGRSTGGAYPYDIGKESRAGELALLDRAVALASARDVPIVLTLLPTYGTAAGAEDIRALEARFGDDAEVYELYEGADVDLSTYWYDDAHLQPAVAGQLTTALLAQHLVDGPLGGARRSTSGP
jgi:hypothetical protein